MANQVQVLRPSGTVTTVNWGLNGAATVHAALSDNTDSSWIDHSATNTGWDGNETYWEFPVSTLSVPTGSQIRGALLRVRAKQDSAPGPMNAGVLLESHNDGLFNPLPYSGGYIGVISDAIAREYQGPLQSYPNYSAASVHAMTAHLGARVIYNQAEVDIFEAYLDIYYNAPPECKATPPTINGSPSVGFGVVSLNDATPIIGWTYTDPENDPQERFQVKVWRWVDVLRPGWNASDSPPVWDSGVQFSSNNFVTLPATTFKPMVRYLAMVNVSDAGSSGRWSGWDNAAQVQWIWAVPPVLMGHVQANPFGAVNGPGTTATGGTSYNASTGQIADIKVRARPNIMDSNSSAFEDIALTVPTINVGGWTADAGTLTADSTHPMEGVGHAKIVADGSGSGHCNIKSLIYDIGIVPGQVMTFLAHVRVRSAVRRDITMTAEFFLNGSSTPMTNAPVTVQNTSTDSHYKKVWLQCVVPANASRTRLRVDVGPCGAGEIVDVDCISITPNCLNLLDNASFEFGDEFWDLSTVVSGSLASVVSVDPGDNTEYHDNNQALALYQPATNDYADAHPGINSVAPSYTHFGHLEGVQFLMSAFVRQYFIGGEKFYMGMGDGGSSHPSYIAANSLLGMTWVWQRFHRTVDCSGIASTADLHPTYRTASEITYEHSILLDDLGVEPLWVLSNGNMESGVLSATVPLTTKLGMTTGTLPQGWYDEADMGTTIYDNAHVHGGSLALAIENGTVAQLFSVGGWSAIPLDFWYAASGTGTFTAKVQQYDSGGYLIREDTVATDSTTHTSFTEVTTSVPVRSDAAYAKLQFTATQFYTVWVDDVSVDSGVTQTSKGQPWLDGGWSGGGFIDWPGNTTVAVLQRSTDESTWTNVRAHQGLATKGVAESLSNFIVNTETFEVTFDDFEWPLEPSDASGQTFYYRVLWYGAFTGANAHYVLAPASKTVTVSPTPVMRLNDWWLVDVLTNANSRALSVKPSVKITQDESATSYVALGRNRRIVVGDVVLGDHITLELFTFTNQQWEGLRALINQQSTLLLRSPDGYQWYVRPVKRSRDRQWTGKYVESALRVVTVDFEEVDVLDADL